MSSAARALWSVTLPSVRFSTVQSTRPTTPPVPASAAIHGMQEQTGADVVGIAAEASLARLVGGKAQIGGVHDRQHMPADGALVGQAAGGRQHPPSRHRRVPPETAELHRLAAASSRPDACRTSACSASMPAAPRPHTPDVPRRTAQAPPRSCRPDPSPSPAMIKIFSVPGSVALLARRPDCAKRTAVVELRYGSVEISRPRDEQDRTLAKTVRLWLVDVREVDPPADAELLHWRLVTTHEINNTAKAWQVVWR